VEKAVIKEVAAELWRVVTISACLATAGGIHAAAIQELRSFSTPPTLISTLVQGDDGALYGTSGTGGSNGYGMVFRVTTNGAFTTLASFAYTNGTTPRGGLAFGPDGALYGTTSGNLLSSNYGTIFRVTTNGALTTLVTFDVANGASPWGTLLLADDGTFYGTTAGTSASDPRPNSQGTVFQVTTDGVLTTLWSFSYTDGASPRSGLVLGSDGAFYGATPSGGTNGHGTAFRITGGGSLTMLLSFPGAAAGPTANLIEVGNGNFYGTTFGGGSNFAGAVFRVTADGTLSVLVSFNYTNGALPVTELLKDSAGNLYGTTEWGGAYTNLDQNGIRGYGTVFRVTTNGALTTLVSFANTNGARPAGGLMWGRDGALYGTTLAGGSGGCGTVFRLTTNGVLTTIASLSFNEPSGPFLGLVQGKDGALYGTTARGGSKNSGTFYRLTTNGTLTTLFSFDYTNGPADNLAPGNDSAFYGTTSSSGPNAQGTVFRITTNGVLTTLASFDGANGAYPEAALTLGRDGAFYGTTGSGGDFDLGTIFRVTTNGVLTSLASFGPNTDGESPQSSLLLGADGAFYGTTDNGGDFGYGTIFRVTTNGVLTTVVYHLPEFAYHLGNLVQVGNGTLYGTMMSGDFNSGSVYSVATNGTFTTTVTEFFTTNGASPRVGLIQGKDGALYGTTLSGGDSNVGTVFRVTTNGTLTPLASFNVLNGKNPYALLQGKDGALYGTASGGGSRGGGNVFRIDLASEMQPLVPDGNGWNVSFVGLPENSYQLLRATNLFGPWLPLTNITVGPDGLGQFTDSTPPPARAFYRTAGP
jgi:uncharacterized repeat protein (TIGR03803 family)